MLDYGKNAHACSRLFVISVRIIESETFSDVSVVEFGVPQRSCLGPLLYTIFTIELPLVLNEVIISMYVDDSTKFMASNPKKIKQNKSGPEY